LHLRNGEPIVPFKELLKNKTGQHHLAIYQQAVLLCSLADSCWVNAAYLLNTGMTSCWQLWVNAPCMATGACIALDGRTERQHHAALVARCCRSAALCTDFNVC
jgi:hypothetical protein